MRLAHSFARRALKAAGAAREPDDRSVRGANRPDPHGAPVSNPRFMSLQLGVVALSPASSSGTSIVRAATRASGGVTRALAMRAVAAPRARRRRSRVWRRLLPRRRLARRAGLRRASTSRSLRRGRRRAAFLAAPGTLDAVRVRQERGLPTNRCRASASVARRAPSRVVVIGVVAGGRARARRLVASRRCCAMYSLTAVRAAGSGACSGAFVRRVHRPHRAGTRRSSERFRAPLGGSSGGVDGAWSR